MSRQRRAGLLEREGIVSLETDKIADKRIISLIRFKVGSEVIFAALIRNHHKAIEGARNNNPLDKIIFRVFLLS